MSQRLAHTGGRSRRQRGRIRPMATLFLGSLLSVASFTVHAAIGDIVTVAGGGAGDGGAAIAASLNNPYGVAVDGAGNRYIADADHHRIRKVDPAGTITTVAGNGLQGFSGDGGAASAASLNQPLGVAVDASGNLYIADRANHRIRKVDTSGVITTVAGDGTSAYGGDGGPAVAASLYNPTGVAVDAAGNLYIADSGNQRIRRVDTAGIITTVAGTGSANFSGDGGPATAARLNQPFAVALDSTGNLYVADQLNQRVRKVDTAGIITTVAGNGSTLFGGDGGAATGASLWEPSGVAVDAAGNLYIADNRHHRIRRVDGAGIIMTIAGNGVAGYSGDGGVATAASLYFPVGVAIDSAGILYIGDRLNARVREVDVAGIITTVAGNGSTTFSGDGGPATEATLADPHDVAVDGAGNQYIADTVNHRIRRVSPAGIITTVAGNGVQGSGGDGGVATMASLSNPWGVTVDASGNLYIADRNNHRIRRVDTAGIITTVAGSGSLGFGGDGGVATSAMLNFPNSVAVDGSGNLYIADTGNRRIRKVDTAGIITTVAGNGAAVFSGDGGPATAAGIWDPTGVAVDGAGNLYIADTNNNRIRKVDTAGIITTVAGNGTSAFAGDGGAATAASLSYPSGITVDGSGILYITDRLNHRIRRVDTAGIITTVAGNGVPTFSGDGGLATAASLDQPFSTAIDVAGNLYIADQPNQRIRRVEGVASLTNNPPTAVDDAVITAMDTAVTTGDVLLNDSDADGDPISLVSVDAVSAQGGTIVDNANNTFTYTPPVGYVGSDSFQYLIQDTVGAQSAAMVNVTINAAGPLCAPTPTGTAVAVSPQADVTVTFTTVTVAGDTCVTQSGTGPAPPTGYRFSAPLPYYDITTLAVYSGNVGVCLAFNPADFGSVPTLRLFHHNGTSWDDITTSLDTSTNVICGTTPGLSPFAIGEEASTAITLSRFSAAREGDRVVINWTTSSETDNWGFKVLRSESPDGPFVPVTTSLIPARGAPGLIMSYTYTDNQAAPGRQYYYRLEDVDTRGLVTAQRIVPVFDPGQKAGTALASSESEDSRRSSQAPGQQRSRRAETATMVAGRAINGGAVLLPGNVSAADDTVEPRQENIMVSQLNKPATTSAATAGVSIPNSPVSGVAYSGVDPVYARGASRDNTTMPNHNRWAAADPVSATFSVKVQDIQGNVIEITLLEDQDKGQALNSTALKVSDEAGQPVIRWQVGKLSARGFKVLRTLKGKSHYQSVVSFVPNYGQDDSGVYQYSFTDQSAKPGQQYDYRLEVMTWGIQTAAVH